jgi:hypothetical protein
VEIDPTAERAPAATRGHGAARIAAVVLVANDAERIATALDSIAWADVRLVVDLGSTDASMECCRRAGIVCTTPFDVIPTLERLDVDWVVLIEGHEAAPPGFADVVRAAVSSGASHGTPAAYAVRVEVRFLGRTLRANAYPERARVRVLDRRRTAWPAALVTIDANGVRGPIGRLGVALSAEPYASLHHYMERIDVLTRAAAGALHATATPVHWWDVALRPAGRLCRFVVPTMLRDGAVGAILSVLEAYRLAVVAAKRWELRQRDAGMVAPR